MGGMTKKKPQAKNVHHTSYAGKKEKGFKEPPFQSRKKNGRIEEKKKDQRRGEKRKGDRGLNLYPHDDRRGGKIAVVG